MHSEEERQADGLGFRGKMLSMATVGQLVSESYKYYGQDKSWIWIKRNYVQMVMERK